MRIIIADDEPPARERIRSLLAREPDAEIAAECGTGQEAVKSVASLHPDLLFLDIQMPAMDGFEVLAALPKDRLPLIIFVTAYNQHAIQAFEVRALDYLLKPFTQARFKSAMQRARETLGQKNLQTIPSDLLEVLRQAQAQPPPTKQYLARVPVRAGERLYFVKTTQIDHLEAAGNYVVLHAGKENHIVRETLTALEAQLDPRKFIRISRSVMVNTDQIKEIQPMFKGEHALILHTGAQLTVTRGVREIQELLKFL